MPAAISEPVPALAMTAPTMPPISACDELDGMPNHQVTTFQEIAPISAPKTTWWSTTPGSTMPLPTVAATFRWKTKIATTLKNAANDDRLLRLQHAGRDDGGDRVRRVVKAVHEVERERQRDQQRDDPERDLGRCHADPIAQEFSRTTPSIRLATSSQRSEIDSSSS